MCEIGKEFKKSRRLREYSVPLVWSVWGKATVEADSEEAIRIALDHNTPLPTDSYYVDNSVEVDREAGIEVWDSDSGDADMSEEKTSQWIVIGRHINGVTLNPLEYILNNKGEKETFENKEAAEAFLKEKGFTGDDIYHLIFEAIKEI